MSGIKNPRGFCNRFMQQGLFDLAIGKDKELDLARTFAPKPVFLSLLLKVGFFAWSVSFLVTDLKDFDPRPFWLAYLANWGAIASMAYQLGSLVSCKMMMREDRHPAEPSLLLKATWVLYPTAATTEIFMTFRYWLFDHPGGAVSYEQTFRHGVLCGLVLFDALLYSRIPLRWKQFLFPYIFNMAWIIWSIIHAFSGIGNPHEEDTDLICAVLDWKKRTGHCLVWVLYFAHVILPGLFATLLGLGKLIGSRSKDSAIVAVEDAQRVEEEADEEKGCDYTTPTVEVH